MRNSPNTYFGCIGFNLSGSSFGKIPCVKTDLNLGRFNLHLDSCVPVPEKSKIDLIEFSGLQQSSNGGTMKMNFEKISGILAIIFGGLTIVTAVYAVNYPWKCRGFYRTYGHQIRIFTFIPNPVKSSGNPWLLLG